MSRYFLIIDALAIEFLQYQGMILASALRSEQFLVLQKALLCFFLCLSSFFMAEEPYGTDASMIIQTKKKRIVDGISPAFMIIRFHQQYSTNIDCPRSHFIPSSSEYMRQAMCFHGAYKGFLLGCDRLLRENSDEWLYKTIWTPKGYAQYDPVIRP